MVHRKATGGYRAASDAEASAILTTLLTTVVRKPGENLLDALRTLAGLSPLQAAGMAT